MQCFLHACAVSVIYVTYFIYKCHLFFKGSTVAWLLMPQTPDPEVGSSSPTRVYICHLFLKGGAMAWWLMPRTPDPEVGGSSPTRVKPCCVYEQGTFTPQKVLVMTQEAVAPSQHD